MTKFLQETTVWTDEDGQVHMNHIYLVNNSNQMIAYIPHKHEDDLDELRIFNKAKPLYKSYRKFKECKELMQKFAVAHPAQYEVLVGDQ